MNDAKWMGWVVGGYGIGFRCSTAVSLNYSSPDHRFFPPVPVQLCQEIYHSNMRLDHELKGANVGKGCGGGGELVAAESPLLSAWA